MRSACAVVVAAITTASMLASAISSSGVERGYAERVAEPLGRLGERVRDRRQLGARDPARDQVGMRRTDPAGPDQSHPNHRGMAALLMILLAGLTD